MAKLSDFETKDISPEESSISNDAKRLSDFNPEDIELSSDPSDLKDLAASIGQGATLGFGDELLAALQASGEVATGEPELSDLGRLYRQYQKQREAEYEEVRRRSPYLAMAGEVAGGILPAIASGGASSTASLGRLALTGAGMGALSSIGRSKGTTEEAISDIKQGKIPELAKDAAFGASIGAATPYVASSVKNKLIKEIEDYPFATQMIESFKEGTKGKGFLGRENLARSQKASSTFGTDLESKIDSGRKFISQQYKEILAPKTVQINPNEAEAFNTAEKILKASGKRAGLYEEGGITEATSEFGKSLLSLQKLKEGKINAQELKDLQKYLRNSAYSPNQSAEAAKELEKAQKFANNILINKVDKYKQVNERFKDFEDSIESILSSVPTESRTIGSVKAKSETPLFKVGKDIVEKSELPYGLGEKQFEKVTILRDELKKLQSSNPEILNKMGISNVDDFIKNIRTQSDIQAVGHVIRNAGQLQQHINILGYGRAGSYLGSNIAGHIASPVVSVAKAVKLPELSRSLYQATDDQLYNVANTLNNSGFSHLGNALNDSIKNKSLTTKNAVLFSIMQNPKIRKAIFGEETNNNE